MISKRLEAMNSGLSKPRGGSERSETYKLPGMLDQLGQTAMSYLEKKKDNPVQPDPLFPDRNSY